jgi:hypothetical protein
MNRVGMLNGGCICIINVIWTFTLSLCNHDLEQAYYVISQLHISALHIYDRYMIGLPCITEI